MRVWLISQIAVLPRKPGIEKGDVIVAVNGAKVKSANALQEQISKYRPGDKVQVTVDRNGSTSTFNVELVTHRVVRL